VGSGYLIAVAGLWVATNLDNMYSHQVSKQADIDRLHGWAKEFSEAALNEKYDECCKWAARSAKASLWHWIPMSWFENFALQFPG
jgi:hypothetical protein